MKTATTVADLRSEVAWLRKQKGRIGFVPTMGGLHDGHLSLVRIARKQADAVAVSIFVNPKQFGPCEDYQRYPRDLGRDRALLEKEGGDLLFAPSVEEMYPAGFSTTVHVAGVSDGMEGARRPGHFDGVATVVARLLELLQPDFAVFGRKDGQQCAVVGRLVEDLGIPVRLLFGETVRERDGLALSSRNVYLSAEERRRAPALYRALCAGREAFERGRIEAVEIVRLARAASPELSSAEWDYLELVDASTMAPVKTVSGPVMLAGAIRLGSTPLIDNVLFG